MHNEELYVLKYTSDVIWVIRSKNVVWVWCVARFGREYKYVIDLWWEKLKKRDHSEDLDVDRIILKYIFK